MKAKKQVYSVSRGLQLTYISVIIGAFGVNLTISLTQMINQLQYNTNLSGYVVYLATSITLPVLLFLTAQVLNPKKLSRMQKLFESTLISSIGFVAYTVYYQLIMMYGGRWVFTNNEGEWSYFVNETIVNAAAFILYASTLFYLRFKKIWK